jgi:hypothetical protein
MLDSCIAVFYQNEKRKYRHPGPYTYVTLFLTLSWDFSAQMQCLNNLAFGSKSLLFARHGTFFKNNIGIRRQPDLQLLLCKWRHNKKNCGILQIKRNFEGPGSSYPKPRI